MAITVMRKQPCRGQLESGGARQKPLSAAPFQSVPIQSRMVLYVDDGNVCRIGRKQHSEIHELSGTWVNCFVRALLLNGLW